MIFIYLLTTLFYAFVNLLLGLIFLFVLFKENLIKKYPVLIVLVTGFLLGQGLLSTLWLFISLHGHLSQALIWTILISISLISIFFWSHFLRLLKESIQSISSFTCSIKNLSFYWKTIFVISILLLIMFAIGSIILPPSGDGETFYMVLPKLMAYTGAFRPPHDYLQFAQIGLLGEFHFAALMIIASAAAAKFLVWINVLAVICLLVYLGEMIGLKTKGQIVALVLVLTSSAFTNYITDGKTDVFSAAFGLAAYYWALQLKKKNWLVLSLAGIFLGFSIVAKLSNVLVIIPGILIIICWDIYREKKEKCESLNKFFKELFLTFLIITFLAGFILLPTVAKNSYIRHLTIPTSYLMPSVQRPILPVSNYQASESQPVVLITLANKTAKVLLMIKNRFVSFLVSPLLLTFWEYPAKGNNLSILFLVFLPFLLIPQHRSLIYKQVLSMSLVGLAIWIIFRSNVLEPRYILSTLLLFIPVIALNVERVLTLEIFLSLKKYILVVIFINLIFCLGIQAYLKFSPAYIQGPHRRAMEFMNQVVKPGQRIFLVGSYSYFLRPELLLTLNAPLVRDIQIHDSYLWENICNQLYVQAPWDSLYKQGFKYVIIQKDDIFPYQALEPNISSANVAVTKIYNDPITDIYTINQK